MKAKTKKEDSLLEIIARNVAEMKTEMATKKDIAGLATKADLFQLELKVDKNHGEETKQVDELREIVEVRQETDMMDLQKRMTRAEKDIRVLNRHVIVA